jgi:phage regulator Rha-like protein
MAPRKNAALHPQADGGARTLKSKANIAASVTQALAVQETHGEPRVDSRILAAHMGNAHQHVRELIEKYQHHFERFGILRFQTGVIKGRGQPERFAMLNEDQCYFLLTLVRNSDHVVDLKARLVLAFREARERRAVTDTMYLPGYHALHDEVMALASLAHDNGSVAGDEVFHCNANKLVNKAAGISAGMRDKLTDAQRLLVVNLQAVVRNALRAAIEAGDDHKAAYQRAKAAATEYAALARRLMWPADHLCKAGHQEGQR